MYKPLITIAFIAANVFFFLVELLLGNTFIRQWSVIPANIMAGRGLFTILTAMFLHGGWMHIIGNMLILWVFAPQIEDVMGRGRFTSFYLLSGLVATIAQVLVNPSSTVPNLGASGAIAGVMGAFLILYPRDRVRVLIFLGVFTRLTVLPAALIMVFWFLTQLLNQFGSLVQMQGGGVAYMAHIGGFIFGALTARLFEKRERHNKQEIFDYYRN
jgi:membrane associated rhomboid family serine protease